MCWCLVKKLLTHSLTTFLIVRSPCIRCVRWFWASGESVGWEWWQDLGALTTVHAWWGFTNVNDRQKIFAVIRRCLRTGFCSPDIADFSNLYSSSDDKLFKKILTRPDHILRTLLPLPTEQNYNLRNRPHNRQLPDRISKITDCNFIVRMLYSDMYWLLYILALVLFTCVLLRIDSLQ